MSQNRNTLIQDLIMCICAEVCNVMSYLNKIFFRGVVTLLPIALTIYILYSGILILDGLMGWVLRLIVPDLHIPLLGLFLTITVIFMFGLLLNSYLTANILKTIEGYLLELPFIKTIYSPLRDLMNLFSRENQAGMKGVVLVELGQTGLKALGIITRENFRDLPIGNEAVEKVAVYLPYSYGVGGFTLLVPKNRLTPLDLPVDKAMRLALTGWVKADSS